MKKGVPISPDDLNDAYKIPPEVIDCFNEMIASEWSGEKAVIDQSKVIDLICRRIRCEPDQVLRRHYLDIEDLYRETGWKVQYYNESRRFVFSPKGGV